MKKRPEPSGASLIQTGRPSVNCSKTGLSEMEGSGCAGAATASAKTPDRTKADRINCFISQSKMRVGAKCKAVVYWLMPKHFRRRRATGHPGYTNRAFWLRHFQIAPRGVCVMFSAAQA